MNIQLFKLNLDAKDKVITKSNGSVMEYLLIGLLAPLKTSSCRPITSIMIAINCQLSMPKGKFYPHIQLIFEMILENAFSGQGTQNTKSHLCVKRTKTSWGKMLCYLLPQYMDLVTLYKIEHTTAKVHLPAPNKVFLKDDHTTLL